MRLRVLVLAPWAVAVAAAEPELEALREAIDAQRERVVDFEREQRGLLERLEEIDRRAVSLARQESAARREAEEARRARVRLEARVAALEPRVERLRRAMDARLVALYKAGELGPVEVLFAAHDLQELFSRVELIQRLIDHDRRLLARYRDERSRLQQARTRAGQAATRSEQARARVRAHARELAAERAGKRELLARVRDSRTRERAALVELESAAHTLEETLSRIGDTRPGAAPRLATSFAGRQGRLEAPVEGPIVREFGRSQDAEFRTQVFRKGVDFQASFGAEVRAVAPGTVRYADWFRGYGRVVILDHGDGYFTVSGHLDEIRVRMGDAVERRDVIGTVGETGSLAGPRLYFEVRRGARALDPGEWLAKREPS